MVFNRFRINCIIRVILLGATSWLFFYLIFRTNLYTALFILGALILYQIYALINYVEKTNRDLARFFQSIKYEDFSQTFKVEGYGSSFDSLKAAFSEVMNAFRKTRAEKEEHFSEDERKRAEQECQKLTDNHVKDVDTLLEIKEKDIMEV